MKRQDKEEINNRYLWDREISGLLGQITPERRAYLIIRYFFDCKEPTEEMCRNIEEWFVTPDRID